MHLGYRIFEIDFVDQKLCRISLLSKIHVISNCTNFDPYFDQHANLKWAVYFPGTLFLLVSLDIYTKVQCDPKILGVHCTFTSRKYKEKNVFCQKKIFGLENKKNPSDFRKMIMLKILFIDFDKQMCIWQKLNQKIPICWLNPSNL